MKAVPVTPGILAVTTIARERRLAISRGQDLVWPSQKIVLEVLQEGDVLLKAVVFSG